MSYIKTKLREKKHPNSFALSRELTADLSETRTNRF